MSANNLMYIVETSKGFEVSMRDIDTRTLYGKIRVYKNLRTAIKKAQQEETEYGLFFNLR